MINAFGDRGCCTDLKCTAYVSSGVTVPVTPTGSPQTSHQLVTTPPTATTITQEIYYYFTITWYAFLLSLSQMPWRAIAKFENTGPITFIITIHSLKS